jgi:hypothetical protein
MSAIISKRSPECIPFGIVYTESLSAIDCKGESPVGADEELKEHAEHARDPFEKRVAATMAVLAAGLAIVSVLGHLATTEELLNQQKASDQWSYYQAKSGRRYMSEIARDLFGAADAVKSALYAKNVEKYAKEDEEIQKEAQALEKESALKGKQAVRLEFAEVFLEVGIVFASLAILSKFTYLWWTSIGSGLIGVIAALTTLMITGS